VKTIPFDGREHNHLDRQPFGQVPFLSDGAVAMFESGACLLHLAQESETLMPRNPVDAAQVLQWTLAALNSVEMVTLPWWYLNLSKPRDNGMAPWMEKRLQQLEDVLSARDWLAAGRFTVADLLMADVLRVPDVRAFGTRPATAAYVDRVTARPAFRKAFADQIKHFEAADANRA
jgi:glutathione S-transferase